jgi:raffinose/stachyose/melibiose transport system substrate-binding protein
MTGEEEKHMRSGPRRRTRPGLLLIAGTAMTMLAAACTSGGSGSASGPSTLKILTWENPPAVSAFKKIDAEFHKKYPNVTVDLETAADLTGSYETLLDTAVDAGSADVVSWYPPVQPLPLKPTRSNMTTWQFWSTQGVFASLSGSSWLSDYTPEALSAETYKGHVYGIVSGAYQEGVFYNKAIFSRYHLAVPATYTQFLADLQTLQAAHVTPMFVGLGQVGPLYLQFLYNELMASVWLPHTPGANLALDLEKGTVKWTSPYFTTAMNEEKTLAGYLEPDYTGVPWESMPGDFANGDSAMLLDGSWDLPAIHQANPSLQVGFFPLPGSNVKADNQPFVGDNLTLSVLRQAPDKQAALDWLQFFSTPSVYAQYVDLTGISSSEKSGTFNSFSAKVLGSWFGKGDNSSVVYPVLPATNAYWDEPANWPTLQLDVIQGTKTPQQAEALYQGDWSG